MSATWSNDGVDAVGKYIARIFPDVWAKRLRLAVDMPDPLDADAAFGDFVECTLAGYAAINLDAFTFQGSTIHGVARYGLPLLIFSFDPYAGPTVDILGYYVTNPANTQWYWAEQYETPVTIPLAGGTHGVLVSISDRRLPPV